MTDPNPLIGRVAQTAKTIVDQSAEVLREESKKIDDGKYAVADAIETVTRLVNVGLAGATDLGRIALEERPPENALALGEYVAFVARRMVSQAGTVAQAASVEVDRKTYTPNKWLQSMTRMIDIAIAGGMEIAETIAAGPAQFERPSVPSDVFRATASGDTRQLSIGTPLKRDASDDDIHPDRIKFDPPVLESPNVEFRLLVNPSGLASGIYRGTVKAGNDEIPVSIAL